MKTNTDRAFELAEKIGPISTFHDRSRIIREFLESECSTAEARCAELENVLRYIAQYGERSGWPRVRQVCELTLAGMDLRTVLREENVPQPADHRP